jgi:ribosomal protein L7/L12
MGSITSQWIVDKLITTPKNEFESGMNSAYISILKEIAPESVPKDMKHEALRFVIGSADYDNMSPLELIALTSAIDSSKLQFVKEYKIIHGTGLKESKDIADAVWNQYDILKKHQLKQK